MEGMAFADPDQAFPYPADRPPFNQAEAEIFGAGGIEPAPPREERGYEQLISPDNHDQYAYQNIFHSWPNSAEFKIRDFSKSNLPSSKGRASLPPPGPV